MKQKKRASYEKMYQFFYQSFQNFEKFKHVIIQTSFPLKGPHLELLQF